ncbi:MAG: discoidin domain-containing protein [Sedimentisphaerales bacterium]|nr:discoidin domain-containing protein [Sedimentisphaerales bacterium]
MKRIRKNLIYFSYVGGLCLLAFSGCSAEMKSPLKISFFQQADRDRKDLAGTWLCRLDHEDVGEKEKWFENGSFSETVKLPGSLRDNGLGDDVSVDTSWTGGIVDRSWFTEPKYAEYREPGNIKVPFWLTPLKYYKGPAWYCREINIPNDWKNKYIKLFLERCHWETKIWVDGVFIGMQNSLSTPHEYDLGGCEPGKHRLIIRVDNRVKIGVGINAHSVSDHTQSNWNGIIGRMELLAMDPVWIEDVQVYPDIQSRRVKVVVTIVNRTGKPAEGIISIRKEKKSFLCPDNTCIVDLELSMGQKGLWDEFEPNIQRVLVSLKSGEIRDSIWAEFGIREFSTEGTQFTINRRKTFLRGTLECCIFPRTGYPPMGTAEWRRIMKIAKVYGLNHLRFHSWCPPEAAFDAADREGMYLHVECPSWANQGSSIGDGKPIDDFIYAEGDRILRTYGNHPSFCMMAYGNEPAGGNQKQWLGGLVNYWKNKDPRRLYTSAAGWPIIDENQYHSTPEPRIQAWGQGLSSRINANPPETCTDYREFVSRYEVPVVSHEIGQWCVYPNFNEIIKYTGTLRAYNFEIFRDSLAANHMLDQAKEFLIASGKLQTLCYKEDIESQLRTPGIGGFQLLDLHDFPGQGTALVGVLDPFWEYKGYVTADEYHRFCSETVSLARMKKRIWTTDETFETEVEIAHFGSRPLKAALCTWRIKNTDKQTIETGNFERRDIPIGNGIPLGSIQVRLADFKSAQKLKLEVAIDNTKCQNDWDIWVYPKQLPVTDMSNVLIVDSLDENAEAVLEKGGNILLLPVSGSVKGDHDGKVPPGFSSIFWNTAWTNRQPPHTLGILCDPRHPALYDFPTEFHSNWQWWDLIAHSQIMICNDLPPALRPIVQVIDDWVTNRRLGLVFEAKVDRGKILVCSVDISSDLVNRPVARQMRYSLLRYINSDAFKPNISVELSQLRMLFEEPPLMQKLEAKVVYVDSQATGYEAAKVIDGDPLTIWHTAWEPTKPDYPHELVIDLGQEIMLQGVTYLPRQDMRNGWISRYAVYVGNDSVNWSDPLIKGVFITDKSPKTIRFAEPVVGRFIRFVAIEGIEKQPYASIAELDILTKRKE